MYTVIVPQGGKEFHFAFDSSADDPAEGVTLTGIFENGRRLRPSSFSVEEIPYEDGENAILKKMPDTLAKEYLMAQI